MIKVRNKHNGYIVYFKFFASTTFPNSFWYTKSGENTAFELGNINDYEPLHATWEEINEAK